MSRRSSDSSSSTLVAGGLLFAILIVVAIVVLIQGPAQAPGSDEPQVEEEPADPFADLPPEQPGK